MARFGCVLAEHRARMRPESLIVALVLLFSCRADAQSVSLSARSTCEPSAGDMPILLSTRRDKDKVILHVVSEFTAAKGLACPVLPFGAIPQRFRWSLMLRPISLWPNASVDKTLSLNSRESR